jgi:beta-glucosidase
MKKKTKRVSGPSSSGATTSLFVKPLGIPNWLLTDGPAGLHLPLCGATCYPVGMVIAQTWDDQAGIRMGSGVGLELKYYNHSVILGPGLNIHRDPLCGRNLSIFQKTL